MWQIHQSLEQDFSDDAFVRLIGVELVQFEDCEVGVEVVTLAFALVLDVRLKLRQDLKIVSLLLQQRGARLLVHGSDGSRSRALPKAVMVVRNLFIRCRDY